MFGLSTPSPSPSPDPSFLSCSSLRRCRCGVSAPRLSPRVCYGGSPDPSFFPLTAISFRIRTSANSGSNPFRICTSKTQDLKPFRIRTYEKTGEGVPRPVSLLCAGSAYSASQRYLCPSSFAVGCKLSTFDSSPRLYRRRNAAKMNNSSSPHGHAV